MDSITALMRVDYTGRGELAERQQKLGQLLSRLKKVPLSCHLAKHQAAIVAIGQSERPLQLDWCYLNFIGHRMSSLSRQHAQFRCTCLCSWPASSTWRSSSPIRCVRYRECIACRLALPWRSHLRDHYMLGTAFSKANVTEGHAVSCHNALPSIEQCARWLDVFCAPSTDLHAMYV